MSGHGLKSHDIVVDLLRLICSFADTSWATEPCIVHGQVSHMPAAREMLLGQSSKLLRNLGHCMLGKKGTLRIVPYEIII